MLRITMRAVFREETTHRAELSDFRRIVVGHSGVGVAGGRRSGGGKSGAGHLGVALACVFQLVISASRPLYTQAKRDLP